MKKLLLIVCLVSAGMFAANAQCTHSKKTAEVESAKTVNAETPASTAVLAADVVEGEAKKECSKTAEAKTCDKSKTAEAKTCDKSKTAEAKTCDKSKTAEATAVSADGKKACSKTCSKTCTKKAGDDVKTTEVEEGKSNVKLTSVMSAEPVKE